LYKQRDRSRKRFFLKKKTFVKGNKHLLIQSVHSWNRQRLFDLDLSFIQFNNNNNNNEKAEIWQSLNQKEDSVPKNYFRHKKIMSLETLRSMSAKAS